MTSFSATDAALEGFRITRERPRALMAWTAFCFAISVVSALITVNMPAEARAALEFLQNDPSATPDAGMLMQALAILSPMLLFGLVVQCIMGAAVYRIILRPQDDKFSYLRLGRDELRLMALTLVYLVLALMAVVAVQIVVAIIATLASFLGNAAFSFAFAAAELFALGLLVFVAVRMSLAPVMTFDLGRLAILDSWSLTRGQFWRLVAAYVLAICCVFVVAILFLMLFMAVSMIVTIATGGTVAELMRIFQPDETTLRTYLNPFMIAYMVVGGLFTAIYYAVVAAPGAVAYQRLSAQA
ncbi:hypothetical protein DJ019_20270 [Phenylobacterium kunshanense]|uniref:Glycerophosphoryl diester phosphodiesterase membrane domain-containing protein n=2 Tax=Phenylobacterium kunshanense TaxID=1445034 RepID=A0A328B8A7_9CAUL|nr:hypothetical protein DJ019_20270 [Phenylobacterium kunshanense]